MVKKDKMCHQTLNGQAERKTTDEKSDQMGRWLRFPLSSRLRWQRLKLADQGAPEGAVSGEKPRPKHKGAGGGVEELLKYFFFLFIRPSIYSIYIYKKHCTVFILWQIGPFVRMRVYIYIFIVYAFTRFDYQLNLCLSFVLFYSIVTCSANLWVGFIHKNGTQKWQDFTLQSFKCCCQKKGRKKPKTSGL